MDGLPARVWNLDFGFKHILDGFLLWIIDNDPVNPTSTGFRSCAERRTFRRSHGHPNAPFH
jgi:hypothetical protein